MQPARQVNAISPVQQHAITLKVIFLVRFIVFLMR
jgi:hypothetical protein